MRLRSNNYSFIFVLFACLLSIYIILTNIWFIFLIKWMVYYLCKKNECKKDDSATWINNIWRLWKLLYTNQIPASAAHLINYPLCWAPQLASDHVRPLEAGQWPWDRPALPRGCLASPSKIFCQHALLAGQWPRLHSIVHQWRQQVRGYQCHVYICILLWIAKM